MTTRMVDGVSTTAYFANDFTLAEIKTLGAVQARAGRAQDTTACTRSPRWTK